MIVHCKKEKYDVLIDRTSKWGNPFIIDVHGTRDEVIAKYEKWIKTQPRLINDLHELEGKILGCWCRPLHACHGQVLEKMVAERNNLGPQYDGIYHINIYSQGKTALGRNLSNFAVTPFTYEPYGTFKSVEGFWYYYFTGCQHEEFKRMWGLQAKQNGKKLLEKELINEQDKSIIIEAIRCKLRQNETVRHMLRDSVLPLKHYYVFGPKIVELPQHQWQIDEINRIRDILHKKHV